MKFSFKHFQFDCESQTLTQDGSILTLNEKSAQLLTLFLLNVDKIHNKIDILEYVWPDRVVTDQVVFQNISYLRSLFGSDAIKTFTRKGYQWQLPLTRVNQEIISLSENRIINVIDEKTDINTEQETSVQLSSENHNLKTSSTETVPLISEHSTLTNKKKSSVSLLNNNRRLQITLVILLLISLSILTIWLSKQSENTVASQTSTTTGIVSLLPITQTQSNKLTKEVTAGGFRIKTSIFGKLSIFGHCFCIFPHLKRSN